MQGIVFISGFEDASIETRHGYVKDVSITITCLHWVLHMRKKADGLIC